MTYSNLANPHSLQIAGKDILALLDGMRAGADIALGDFKAQFWHNYQPARHQQAIDAKLTDVANYVLSGGQRGIKRLMIFMPPRHGKTMTVSRMFPAWILGRDPRLRIIMASYGATLAYRNSRTVRNLIQTPGYPFATRISDDTAARQEWDTTDGGGVIAAGVGGGITGHGGKLAILDDVIKSRAEAESETYRQRAIDWYINDLMTRIEEPGGAIILMMTRWHMYDLAGYLLDNEADDWHVLSLPALALDDDPLGRDLGAALWPEAYSETVLHERRERMGEYAFASLYQQQPLASKAGLFDVSNIETILDPPPCDRVVRFYDLAVTAKKHSDYSAGAKLGITANEDVIILDMYRVQKRFPNVEQDIVSNAIGDGRDCPIRLEADKAGIVGLDYLVQRRDLRGYTLDARPPQGDKFTRAQPFASRVNARKVKMVKAHWNRALLDELAVFPMGANDDQVDALSGAYAMLSTPPGKAEWTAIPNIFGHDLGDTL